MASLRLHLFLSSLFLSTVLIDNQVLCADEEDDLFQGINLYRTSLNLTTLKKNDNADCLAGEIADQFKGQPCTNSTGSNTVQGTEPQFANYPRLLEKCHLNITDTRDGMIMPACVPKLARPLVLSNFTMSQYSQYLNDTTFAGIGIGSEGDWIVVALTTNTSGGSFETEKSTAKLPSKVGLIYHLLTFLMGYFFL